MAKSFDFDPQKAWDAVLDTIEDGLADLLSVEGKTRDLVATKAYVDAPKQFDDYAGQRETKLRNGSWDVPVYADLELRDKSGKRIRRVKKLPLFRMPQLTPRHSYTIKGTEYQLSNQLRLKPGVYTRVRQNGEIESFLNLAKGGKFRMTLDPEDGRIRLRVGTSSPAVYPLLKILNVRDEHIRQTMGPELYEINRAVKEEVEVPKLYKALFRKKAEDMAEAENEIRDRFQNSVISPDTTKVTLGESFQKADGPLFLATMRKLIDVQRGLAEPDRRDAPIFKEIYDPSDIFKERLSGPNRREVQFRIRRRLDPLPGRKVTNRIRDIVEPHRLQKIINAQFVESRLSHNPTQINPLEMLQETQKLTLTGEGGIVSRQAITNKMRNIEPSQLGFIDPLHTPEGQDIGVSTHLTIAAGKRGRDITSVFYDKKKNKYVELTPAEIRTATVAFPGWFRMPGEKTAAAGPTPKSDMIPAYRNSELVFVKPNEVDYILPSPKFMLDYSTNLLPFVDSLSAPRVLMAAKHQQQAVSLKEREAPLVQPAMSGKSFVDLLGRESGISEAPEAGTVRRVGRNSITLETKKGETVKVPLYRDYPLNSKSYLNSEPVVRTGDSVKKGQVLADTNFTRNGTLALGKNLLLAYVPYKGHTYEDGVTISESAAKKLTSLHMHREDIPLIENRVIDKKKYMSYYPTRFTSDQLKHIGVDGLPEVGSRVRPGDALALVLRKSEVRQADRKLGRISRTLIQPYRNEAVSWDEEVEGEVVDVNTDGGEVTILIKTEEPVVEGDKIAGRSADKGIVGKIVPDNEMLRTETGEIIDVVMNPLILSSRINPAQAHELVLAKAAKKMGGPIKIDNFDERNNEDVVREAAEKAGVSARENLIDPVTGLTLKGPDGQGILVGPRYIQKLDHPVRKKFSARAIGPYVADLVPAKKSGESAQSIDPLTFFSIAAHGSTTANLREMGSLKAESRPEVWRSLIMGEPLPPPKPTEAFGHLVDLFKSVGVRMDRKGNNLRLLPMTDKEILGTSRGEISSGRMYQAKSLRPERGGLFDPVTTGGTQGDGWGHVVLAEPLPNPIFEKAILSMAEITSTQLRGIIEGSLCVDATGKIQKHSEDDTNCAVGGPGLQRLLRNIDLKKELISAKQDVAGAREDQLNRLNRRIRFLSNFQNVGLKPEDMVLRNVPVMPPRLRPIYNADDGTLIVSDLNKLYRDVVELNNKLKEMNDADLGEEHKASLRRDVYDATRALFGVGSSLSDPKLTGITRSVTGHGSPKGGFFQQKVVRRRQDLTGRSTVIPGPDLSVDEVGLPEEMAWQIFRPFVMKKLVSGGMRPVEAENMIGRKDPFARKLLDQVVDERPVMMNRSPSLHRHNFLAMKPVLVSGRAIRVNPLVVKGYNMDFDGDTAAIHVPITQAAVGEAWNLLPSKNAFSASSDFMLAPRHEMQLGLYLLSQEGQDRGHKFSADTDALAAMDRGEIEIDEVVHIGQRRTTPGRIAINSVLPEAVRDDNIVMDKKNTTKILAGMAQNNPTALAPTLDALKTLGSEGVYRVGYTFGPEALSGGREIRDKYVQKAQEAAAKVDPRLRAKVMTEVLEEAIPIIEDYMKEKHPRNPFIQSAASGARGSIGQVRQMLVAPLLFQDVDEKTIPYPVTKSYSEGLDPTGWWFAAYGGRKGLIDKVRRQSEPGALNKSLIATSINHQITMTDCGTSRGILMEVTSRDALGRVLAQPTGRFRAGEVLSEDVLGALEKARIQQVLVRSPITCEASHGVCAQCYGHDERGRFPPKGTPVGIISSQALTEPASQSMLNSFHTGGAVRGQAVVSDSMERIRQLMQFPKVFQGKGALARRPGTVKKIQSNPAGGFFVDVEDDRHLVPPGQEPIVERGKKVLPGQMLSTGAADPRDVLKVLGPTAARKFVSDSLKDVYAGTGMRVPSRHFEEVARAVVNTTRIIGADEEGRFLEGDVAPLDAVMAANLRPKPGRVKTLHPKFTKGMALLEDIEEVGGLGKILDDKDVEMLSNVLRKPRVRVNTKPIAHQPVLTGIDMAPLTRRDWLSHLAHRHLGRVFQEGVPQGWESDVKGPLLPAYLFGSLSA